MIDEQKKDIETLRKEGVGYARIASLLNLPPNTVKSFCRRYDAQKTLCRNCGKPLEQTAKRKPKAFCGDWCRQAWWNAHRDQLRKKAARQLRCAHCGKHFEAYGSQNRKYCSHECYVRERFGRDAP
jgi:endogenous inhibitor of DNA gyrase (YacG/DUF329 family)